MSPPQLKPHPPHSQPLALFSPASSVLHEGCSRPGAAWSQPLFVPALRRHPQPATWLAVAQWDRRQSPAGGSPHLMAILASRLPIIHKEEAENEFKKVKGGRFATPGMQKPGRIHAAAFAPHWWPRQRLLPTFGTADTRIFASKPDIQTEVQGAAKINQLREDGTLDPPDGAGTYKKRWHECIARSLQMGTHLIMKHRGDRKTNKEQQGCRKAAALRNSRGHQSPTVYPPGDCRVTWSHQGQDLGIPVAQRTLLISQGNTLSSLIFMQLV